MRKNTVITLMCALFSSSICAAMPFNGFYGSVDAGLMTSDLNLQSTSQVSFDFFIGSPQTQTFVNPIDLNLADNSLTGGLALGFGHVFNNSFFLGLEGRANFENIDFDSNKSFTGGSINSTVTFQQALNVTLSKDFDVLFKLGYVANQSSLIYLIAGPVWAKFNESSALSFAQSVNFGGPMFTATGNVSGEDSSYEGGWLAGIGFEYLINPQVSLALEYANYGDIDFPDSLSAPMTIVNPIATTPQTGTIQDLTTMSVTTNNTVLRLTYYIS